MKLENDYTEKITHKKFEILVNSLDKTHDDVRRDMCSQNGFFKDEYLKNATGNFSNMIRKKGYFIRRHEYDEEDELNDVTLD